MVTFVFFFSGNFGLAIKYCVALTLNNLIYICCFSHDFPNSAETHLQAPTAELYFSFHQSDPAASLIGRFQNATLPLLALKGDQDVENRFQ